MSEQEISLDDMVQVVKKRWKLILFPSILAALIAALLVTLQPKTYESYALVKIGYSGQRSFEEVNSLREIMSAAPLRVEIARKLNEENNKKLIDSLVKAVKYEDKSGLLKISAVARSPQRALEIVRAVTGIIYERHQRLYSESQKSLNSAVTYVKETIRPVPLSSSISEFRIEPTKIEIDAIENKKPVASKGRIAVLLVFFCMLFGMLLVSFYLEGKEK